MPVQLPKVAVGGDKAALRLDINTVTKRGLAGLRHIKLNKSSALIGSLVSLVGSKSTEMRTESMDDPERGFAIVNAVVCVP